MLTLSVSMATSRSLSSSKCDCSSVFCSKQVGDTARLPAHKRRFYGYPDKSHKSVFSGVLATADGVMSVDKMPTAQCSFLHRNTARHTGLAHMKSTQINCALNVCPQTLRSACLKVSVKRNQHAFALLRQTMLSVL
ncbi:hypothetical protein PO909_004529 [Leuciscus waleckii]